MGIKYPGLLIVFLLPALIGISSGAIYVENATVFDFSLNTTSTWLNSSIDSVQPRIFMEHIDSILGQSLTTPSMELNNSLNSVRPRIFTEHIDSILSIGLTTPSLGLNNSLNTVRPRIFTEHIDSILSIGLTTPSLGLNNSLNTVRPRIFTEHIDSILGLGLTTPSLELNNSLNSVRPRIFTEHIDSMLIQQLNVTSPELDNSISKVKPRIFVESADMLWFKPFINDTLNFTPPSTPPVPLIVSPSDGSIISGIVDVNATTSSSGITSASFDYTIDGLSWTLIGKDTNGDDGWNVLWDTTEVSDGVYALKVIMVDVNGSSGTNSIAVTVFNHPKVILTALPSRKTVENINASHSIGIFNSQYNSDTFDITILNPDNAAVVALDQSSITIPPWGGKEVTLNVTDDTPGEYTVNVSAISRSNPNITGIVAVKTIVKESFNISLVPIEGTRTSIGANITYSLILKNNQLYSDSFTLTAVGINPSWISLDASHILSSGEEMTIPIVIPIPETAISGDFILTISATSSNTGTSRSSSLPLNIQNEPIITGLVPKNGSRLGSDSVIFTWTTNLNSTTKVILNQSGAETVYTGDDSVYHSIIVDNLTRNQWYTYRAISNTSHGSTVSEVRSFYIDNGISFTQKIYNFGIERNYDQRATITVKNTDNKAHELLLTVNSDNSDLIVGFVGNGSQDKRITLAPSEVEEVTLAIHAQDAMQENYYLVLNLTADENLTDYAVANVLVRQPIIDLRLEEVSTDPMKLTKTMRVTNHGDTVTGLNIYASGDLRGNVTFQPTITHGNLLSGGSITFDVAPILSLNFTRVNGTIIAETSGSKSNLNVNYTLPDGKGIYLGYVGDKRMNYYNHLPESIIFFPEQIQPSTVFVPIGAIFNNSLSVFMINRTEIVNNNITIFVDSLVAEEGDSNISYQTAHVVFDNLTEGSYSISIKEPTLNETITTKSFIVQSFGRIFNTNGLVANIGTFKGESYNGTFYMVPMPTIPIIPPGQVFNLTNFWVNSTEDFILGINLINTQKTDVGMVNLSLNISDENISLYPKLCSFDLNETESNLCIFKINTTGLTHGIYNITFNLSSTNFSINGTMPFGVYETISETSINDSIVVSFLSPFNDSMNVTASNWENYTLERGYLWDPINVTSNVTYSNFTLEEPHSPWAHIVIGAVAGGVIKGGLETAHQYYLHGNDYKNYSWGKVAENAAIGGVEGAVFTATFGTVGTPVLILGAAKGGLMSGGLEMADQFLTYHGEIRDMGEVYFATADGAIDGGLTAGLDKLLKSYSILEKGVPEGKYLSGSWKNIGELWNTGTIDNKLVATFEYLQRSHMLTQETIRMKTGIFILERLKNVYDFTKTRLFEKMTTQILEDIYGLSSETKIEFGNSLKSLFSNEDVDGDGVSNLIEMMFGSDPINPNESPGITVRFGFQNWYCTNRPTIHSTFTLPNTIKQSLSPTPNIENGYLVMRFTLPWPRDYYRPHNVNVYLNDVRIGRLENIIPEGHYIFRFDPSILNYADSGAATNTVTLTTENINGGHYVVATDMQVILPMKREEMYVVASNQSNANEIIKEMSGEMSNRADFGIYPEDINFSTIKPIAGENVTINATIFNLGTVGAPFVSIQFLDNGIQIGENMTLGFIASLESVPVNITWKSNPGVHTISIKVNSDKQIQEYDYSNNEASKFITVGSTSDKIPPQSIANPSLQAAGTTWLNFTWLNPPDPDFSHVMLYLNGTFLTNVYSPQNYYNITGLSPNTSYELATHTVDTSWNVNQTWVNATARTAPFDVSPVIAFPCDTCQIPTDPDSDGLYEDINGNSKPDFNDVVVFFNYLEWVASNEPIQHFDFNGNGRIDFNDVIKLFEEL